MCSLELIAKGKDVSLDIVNNTYCASKKDILNVPRVNTILNGYKSKVIKNQAIENGTLLHTTLDNYFKTNQLELDNLSNEIKSKATLILDYIHKNNIKPKITEEAFIAKDTAINFLYGGTVDLLHNDAIFDWKSGSYYPNYDIQLSAYAKAFNVTEAKILYFNDNKLLIKELDKQNIEDAYTIFQQKARIYNQQSNIFDDELLLQFKEYEALIASINALEETQKDLKQTINQKLQDEGWLGTYKVGKFTFYKTKDSEVKSIKPLLIDTMVKQLKEKLNYQDSDIYDYKTRKGSIAIKIKDSD